MIRFSVRGTYLLLVLQGRAVIRERELIRYRSLISITETVTVTNLCSFVFPRVSMFPDTSSRETSRRITLTIETDHIDHRGRSRWPQCISLGIQLNLFKVTWSPISQWEYYLERKKKTRMYNKPLMFDSWSIAMTVSLTSTNKSNQVPCGIFNSDSVVPSDLCLVKKRILRMALIRMGRLLE